MIDHTFFKNIRDAHRYSIAYQKRILTAMGLINSKLEEIDFIFDYWYPKYNKMTCQGTTEPWWRWIWDFFPLSHVSFRWKRVEKDNSPGSTYVFIDHIVDTKRELCKEGEPDPLQFDEVDSQTVMRAHWVAITETGKPFSEDKWKMSWENLLTDFLGIDELKEIWPKSTSTILPQKKNKDGVIIGFFSVLLDDLATPDDFDNKFIKQLINQINIL